MHARTTLLLLFCFACPADLSRFAIEGEDPDADSGPRPDGGPLPDGAPRPDGGSGDDCDPAPTCAAGCPLPWLLASVEDLDPSDACGGRVLRWSLGDREECVCSSLGAGVLELPFAVGFVPPNSVVAVDQDGTVSAIDGDTDRLQWTVPSATTDRLVADVFPLADPSGVIHTAVAFNARGTQNVNELVAYDATGSERMRWAPGATTLPGGSGMSSITLSSHADRRMRALKPNGGFAAAEIDPWTGNVISTPYHTLSREGFFLGTISALYWGGTHRTVWTGRRTDLSPQVSEIYTLRSTVPRDDNRVPLGDECNEDELGLAYDAVCDFVHAVPDPLDDFHTFAICEIAPGERRVVRLYHFDGQCSDLAQDSRLFPRARFSKLAIALPSYWE